jgi:arabinogalactan oligomer / maltooligosaccharide transport system permease protein
MTTLALARRKAVRVLPSAAITVIALAVLIPLLWVIVASLRQGRVLTGGLFDFTNFGWGNYVTVLHSSIPRNFLNSVIACSLASILAVAVGAVTGYGFSRFSFPGSKAIFWGLLLIQLIPAASLVVPLYKLWGNLGLFNNLGGLAVAYAGMSTAVCVLLLKGYIDDIPRELDEAAAIDGCSRWTTFWRVIFPLLRPALAACGIYAFIGAWQEFVIASSLINDNSLATITVGLQNFSGQYTTDYGAILAGSVVTALPIIVLFALFQKQFVSTVTGGIKG